MGRLIIMYYLSVIVATIILIADLQMVVATSKISPEEKSTLKDPSSLSPVNGSINTNKTSSTTTQQLPLNLSFFELHVFSDALIELTLLNCPSLDLKASHSLKEYLRDRFQNSDFQNSNNNKFSSIRSELGKCQGKLSGKSATLRTKQKPSGTIPATLTNEVEEVVNIKLQETTTLKSEPSSTTAKMDITTTSVPTTITPKRTTTTTQAPASLEARLKSFMQPIYNWVSDVFTKTTSWFTSVFSRKKRDLSSAIDGKDEEEFDEAKQAKENFEEMIHAMMLIVSQSCNLLSYEKYMSQVEKEMMYWISKENREIIFLSDYYFSMSNLLQLARKCPRSNNEIMK